jgi:signal transduction histidine kinase
MAYRLHPAILDDLGLPAAVGALADDFTKRHGIEITFRDRHFPRRISMELASCLYRVVQESLANISKHSQSPKVAIRLAGTGRGLRLSIRDYGVGFDVHAARNHRTSLGIVSMEERVRMVEGTLSIWSFPRRGTRIRVTIPVTETRDIPDPD